MCIIACLYIDTTLHCCSPFISKSPIISWPLPVIESINVSMINQLKNFQYLMCTVEDKSQKYQKFMLCFKIVGQQTIGKLVSCMIFNNCFLNLLPGCQQDECIN